MLGVAGLEEVRDAGLAFDDDEPDDFVAERDGVLADDDLEADFVAEPAGLLLAALGLLAGVLTGVLAGVLAGVLTGVLVSTSALAVKLISLIGDTSDLLLARDFLVEAAFRFDAGRFLLVDAAVLFLIGVGVVLAFEDAFGRGVPLIGFEALLAGVGVCLAIVYLCILIILIGSISWS